MNLSFNVFQLLILIGAVNGFVWSALIITRKQRKKINIFLGLFVLVFAMASIKIVLQEKIPNFNHELPIPLLYQFSFGPLLYLYLKSSLTDGYRFSTAQLWHFTPSLLFDLLPALLLFTFRFSSYTAQVEKLSFLSDVMAFIFFTGYWCLSFSVIRQYKRHTDQVKNKAVVNWINKVLLASSLIVVTWLIYILWVIFLKGRLIEGMMPYYPVYLILSFCIYGIGIAGYYRPEIGLLDISATGKRELVTPGDLEVKKTTILNAMKEHNWYQDETITLQKLARQMDMPVNELSYIINTGFRMNFSDFVNELRIDYFKQRLSEPLHRQYNMLGLAYEAGFSSKASFYRAFKKSTCQTPAEFYKKQQKLT